jgi:hypothetical protein
LSSTAMWPRSRSWCSASARWSSAFVPAS